MTHLILVGMPGSGKTTVAQRCADVLARPLVDTDEVIERTSGQSATDLFAIHGEERFRDLEQQAVADVCASPTPLVIASGGGAVLRPANREALRRSGFVAWLRTAPEELARRVGDGDARAQRPLLTGPAPAVVTLTRLAALREAAYAAAAHAVVDTDGQDPDDVASDVLARFAAAQ